MSETLNKGPNLERQSSESLTIPERRVIVKDANDLPSTYSQTPGGTIFSTTPGGTRIIYDRRFLLQMRNSPLTKTPPVTLSTIPDILNEDISIGIPEKTKSPEPPKICGKAAEYNLARAEAEVFPMD